MKSIKKITNKVTDNFSGLAGSALLLGATLVGGAAFATAQDSGSSGDSMGTGDLGEFPQPFVTEDGQVQTSIVLGSDAAVTDVVGATEIAGSLGNAAFETGTESVAVSGGAAGSWSATNGVTLDTANDDLFFGSPINDVRQTLTEDNLDVLEEVTFSDDSNDETDITNYLGIGNYTVSFGNSPDGLDNEDPVVHLELDAESNVGPAEDEHLFNVQSTFENQIDFTSSDVEGEDITLFGQPFTVANDQDEDVDELVLFGNEDVVDVGTGESTTVTVDGNEVTLEVVSVASGSTGDSDGSSTVRIDGNLDSASKGYTESFGNEEVRVDEIFNTGATDDGQGTVQFAIGSQELRLMNGTQIEDSNGDDLEGSYVEFSGDNITELSGLTVYAGAENDDDDYLEAGDTFTHSALPGLEFHFGGLNPDTSGEDAAEVEVTTNGDDTAEVSFPATGDESATLGFAHSSSDGGSYSAADIDLSNDDDDAYRMIEGVAVAEDEYVAADAGDFPHLYEVTSVDADDNSEEAEVDIRDAVTGDDRTLELPANSISVSGSNDATHADEEIIDGQTYHVWVDDSDNVYMTWGDGSDYADVGSELTVFPALDAPTGHAVTFTSNQSLPGYAQDGGQTIEVPSTESTDQKTGSIDLNSRNIDSGISAEGQISYDVTTDGAGSSTISPAATGNASVVMMHPENDNDAEQAYVVEPGYDSSDDEVTVSSSPTYTGNQDGGYVSLESNDDIEAAVDEYGSYSEVDTDEQGSFTLNVAAGQATAGAAITTDDGELSSEGGGTGSVETSMPTYQYADGVLADDSNVGQVKDNENVVMVGGPAANSLVQELVAENQTMPASDYTQGQGMIQMVDGFPGGQGLIVAGATGEDTREAAEFLADYRNNQDALEGQSEVTIETSSGSVVS